MAPAEQIVKAGNVTKLSETEFAVKSFTSEKCYNVTFTPHGKTCTCSAWKLSGKMCKHGYTTFFFASHLPTTNDSDISTEVRDVEDIGDIVSQTSSLDLFSKGKAGKKKASSIKIKSYKKRGKNKALHYILAFPQTPSPKKGKKVWRNLDSFE